MSLKFSAPFLLWTCIALFSWMTRGAGADDDSNLSPLVRCFAEVETPAPPFSEGKFSPGPGETIALIGGTNTFDLQKSPYLETLLQLSYPELDLKVRNLVWQGDTVLHQTRPRFYFTKTGDKQPGSVPDQRQRVAPGIVFVNFGKMESLEPGDSLANFLKAYRTFLDQLQSRTRRIILFSPTPFFPVGPAKDQTQKRNEQLAQFEAAIRELAKERKFLYVDQFHPLAETPNPALSSDGIHLSDAGQRQSAILTARALQFPIDPVPALESPKLQALRQSLKRKDFLWHQYYHPTNWAFLYGDRQSQPASRSHLDKDKRWFRDEVDELPALIREVEADIHRYAAQAATAIGK